jgi:hypothetical protein
MQRRPLASRWMQTVSGFRGVFSSFDFVLGTNSSLLLFSGNEGRTTHNQARETSPQLGNKARGLSAMLSACRIPSFDCPLVPERGGLTPTVSWTGRRLYLANLDRFELSSLRIASERRRKPKLHSWLRSPTGWPEPSGFLHRKRGHFRCQRHLAKRRREPSASPVLAPSLVHVSLSLRSSVFPAIQSRR